MKAHGNLSYFLNYINIYNMYMHTKIVIWRI